MQQEIPIGEFKTHCNQILTSAQEQNQELAITRKGKIIAKIIPVTDFMPKKSLFGMLQSKAIINGDLTADLEIKWDAQG